MFTGIIEGLGTISAVRPSDQGRRLSIEADFFMDQTKIGDSIAVNGACLTAVRVSGKRFDVDVSPETLQMTTLGNTKIGTRVNLERALRLSDRLDGHLVSGHIDGTGILTHRKTTGNAIFIGFSVPGPLARYMIKKGSIAVDGVSLTINTCNAHGFEVCIIPHTARLTTVGQKKTGEEVNIETDIIGKYVERLFPAKQENDSLKEKAPLDMQFLANTGFL